MATGRGSIPKSPRVERASKYSSLDCFPRLAIRVHQRARSVTHGSRELRPGRPPVELRFLSLVLNSRWSEMTVRQGASRSGQRIGKLNKGKMSTGGCGDARAHAVHVIY